MPKPEARKAKVAVLLAALAVSLSLTAQQPAARAGSIGVQFPQAAENQERLRQAGLTEGVWLQAVAADSPAEKAGLRAGDIIIACNGEPVRAGDDFVQKVSASPVGQRVVLHYVRAGVRYEVALVVADRAEVYPHGTVVAEPGQSVQLIRGEPNPQIRIAVAHQHTASGCFGYLYLDRQTIHFEVKWPLKDQGHSFSFPRSSLTVARQWTFVGTALPEAELKFGAAGGVRGEGRGATYHFFHVDPSLPETPGAKFQWQNARDWQAIVTAAQDFERLAAQLRPPAPPAPSKPQMASLQIEAQSGGAEFYVDDEFRGATSSEGRIKVSGLQPGEHRLRLSKKNFAEWNRSVTLEAGENRTIEVQLVQAKPPEPLPPETTLELADVLKLLEGGVTPARLETIVKDRGVSFELTDEAEKRLRALGATDALLLAIAKAKK